MFFNLETLDVYRVALELVVSMSAFGTDPNLRQR
jgi:hypothetical protein